jgi:hypothetical protein
MVGVIALIERLLSKSYMLHRLFFDRLYIFVMIVSLVLSKHVNTGRTIAQAVSRRLPTAAAWVQTRVWSCGIL